MKVFYVYNGTGINEIYDPEELGVDVIPIEEWDDVSGFESDIIKEYKMYDGVGRVVVEDNVGEQEVIDEMDRIDEELW